MALAWSAWFDPRLMRPPWGCEAEWELTTRTRAIAGRTAHLCQMTDEGRHEVVFLSAAPPRRVYFVEEVLRWRIMCAPDLFDGHCQAESATGSLGSPKEQSAERL